MPSTITGANTTLVHATSTTSNTTSITSNQPISLDQSSYTISKEEFATFKALLSKFGESLNVSQTTDTEPMNQDLSKFSSRLRNLFNKKHKLECQLSSFKSLIEANKTTPALHFTRLPPPLFKDNLQFIQQWNALVKDFQVKSMSLLISSNKDSIKETNDEILQLKKEMITQTKEPDRVSSELAKIESSSKRFELDRNKESFAKTVVIIESTEPTEFIYKVNAHRPRSSNHQPRSSHPEERSSPRSQSSHRRKSTCSYYNKPEGRPHYNYNNENNNNNNNNNNNTRKSFNNNNKNTSSNNNKHFNNRNSNRRSYIRQEEN